MTPSPNKKMPPRTIMERGGIFIILYTAFDRFATVLVGKLLLVWHMSFRVKFRVHFLYFVCIFDTVSTI